MSKNLFDLDTLFKEWYNLKKDKKKLEDREDDIKTLINKIMKKENTNKLEGDNFSVSKKYQTKKYITQKTVPSDIWEKYYKKTEYSVLYLKKI